MVIPVDAANSHLLIAGPGRSGTSLLVRLLAELGMETGSEALTWFPDAHAGLESLLTPDAPYVVKNPALTWQLESMLASGEVEASSISGVVLPIRELDEVVASRFLISAKAGRRKTPGGLSQAHTLAKEREGLSEMMYRLCLVLARYEIPAIFLAYPEFAIQCEYAYRQLRPVLPDDVDDRRFQLAWHKVTDSELVRSGSIQVPRRTRLWWENRFRIQYGRRRVFSLIPRKQAGP